MRDIVELAERELFGKRLTFHLTTNAALMTEEMMSFMEAHHFYLTISLDGLQAVNDKNRVTRGGQGSFETVMQKIRRIRERHPALFDTLRISSVIDPETDCTVFGQYPEELVSLPPDRFTVGLVESTDRDIVVPLEFRNAMAAEQFVALFHELQNATLPITPYGYQQIQSTKTAYGLFLPTNGVAPSMAPSGPCVPGKGRLFITVDGSFYPCEKVNEVEPFCIGSLAEGISKEKSQKLLNIVGDRPEGCSNCWAIRHCTMCAKSWDASEDTVTLEQKQKQCGLTRRSAHEKMRTMILFYEMNTLYKEGDRGGKKENRDISSLI